MNDGRTVTNVLHFSDVAYKDKYLYKICRTLPRLPASESNIYGWGSL